MAINEPHIYFGSIFNTSKHGRYIYHLTGVCIVKTLEAIPQRERAALLILQYVRRTQKKIRSYNYLSPMNRGMSRIKSRNIKPEMLVRRFLHANGFRYKLHDKSLPATPDIVLPIYKTVIFVHGCFWHGHEGCKYYVVPKTRTEWWLNKINGNIANDVKASNH